MGTKIIKNYSLMTFSSTNSDYTHDCDEVCDYGKRLHVADPGIIHDVTPYSYDVTSYIKIPICSNQKKLKRKKYKLELPSIVEYSVDKMFLSQEELSQLNEINKMLKPENILTLEQLNEISNFCSRKRKIDVKLIQNIFEGETIPHLALKNVRINPITHMKLKAKS